MDREKITDRIYDAIDYGVCVDLFMDILELLKEQDELLHKLQKDKDKLCLDVSEWKHKYHDRPLKEQEAVEPKVEKAILDYQSWHYICGDCGGQIDIQDNYCRHCGRVVAHLSNRI